ncbi:hypothetical protein FRC17_006181, partial [Serendipita sp. 399]
LISLAAGSDVAAIRTTARISEDKRFYIVNGSKKWITGGLWADWMTAAVRTGGPGANGISLLVIPLNNSGVKRRRIRVSGLHASGSTFFEFDDIKVPVENLIGKEGDGFRMVMANFNPERFNLAVMSVQLARNCVEEAFKHAVTRKTFGAPLISHQIIRAKFASMIRAIESCHSWIEELAWHIKVTPNAYQQPAIGARVALLKVQAGKVLELCVREAQQVFGGLGMTKDGKGSVVEQLSRDMRVFVVGGGSEEILDDLSIRTVLLGVLVGTLSFSTPSLVGASVPFSFSPYILTGLGYIFAITQLVGFLGVFKEKAALFRRYVAVNMIVLYAGFSVAATYLGISAARHSQAVTLCQRQFFGHNATESSIGESEGYQVCNIFCWATLGVMGALWVLLFVVQSYLALVLRNYGVSQRADHIKYHSIYSTHDGDRNDIMLNNVRSGNYGDDEPWDARPSTDSWRPRGEHRGEHTYRDESGPSNFLPVQDDKMGAYGEEAGYGVGVGVAGPSKQASVDAYLEHPSKAEEAGTTTKKSGLSYYDPPANPPPPPSYHGHDSPPPAPPQKGRNTIASYT